MDELMPAIEREDAAALMEEDETMQRQAAAHAAFNAALHQQAGRMARGGPGAARPLIEGETFFRGSYRLVLMLPAHGSPLYHCATFDGGGTLVALKVMEAHVAARLRANLRAGGQR